METEESKAKIEINVPMGMNQTTIDQVSICGKKRALDAATSVKMPSPARNPIVSRFLNLVFSREASASNSASVVNLFLG